MVSGILVLESQHADRVLDFKQAAPGTVMKSFFSKDAAVNEGNTVTSFFVVVSKQTRQKENGEPYVHLVLADCTGTIDGKLWEQVGLAGEIQPDDFVKVQGEDQTATANNMRSLSRGSAGRKIAKLP
jgi:hypothetical protein